MPKFAKSLALVLVALPLALPAFAADYTKGTVQKVDARAKKLTIKHEELANLDMPAMTMVFVVADPSMLEKAKEGQAIEFVAERIRGKLTVIEMK
ncbi:copper-binding protein [Aurantimonas sp. VKM B-3413]|uniref:copper-binding protein n=1 Tax=Aurantimonas sp. VKM B-3413 TaxID=2779401 RepID=UPI001E31B4DF|nr:copper-binding protein [Aurantimonas sp. VKM B-3413]MCB8840174.1 copper-binding protein [Aurantimonas sp. VKM B-3413]